MPKGYKSLNLIEPSWIQSLEARIDEWYGKHRYSYTEKELKHAAVQKRTDSSHPTDIANVAEYKLKFNPFNLQYPAELESASRLFRYMDSRETLGAAQDYYDFLRKYNLAYISFLRAIDGSAEDLEDLKRNFIRGEIFSTEKLSSWIAQSKHQFLLALLTYLAFSIVFSKASEISSDVRINALQLLSQFSDADKLAVAFENFKKGYVIDDPTYGKLEEVFDLIPRRFMTQPTEMGGSNHCLLFFSNQVIRDLFKTAPVLNAQSRTSCSFDVGMNTLLNKHPRETVHVLHSLIRLTHLIRHDDPSVLKLCVVSLINLSILPGLQKYDVFGPKASYRSEDQGNLSQRMGWALGTERFGNDGLPDDLQKLSRDELIALLLQTKRLQPVKPQMNLVAEASASVSASSSSSASASAAAKPTAAQADSMDALQQGKALASNGLFKNAKPQVDENKDIDELSCPLTLELINKVVICSLDDRAYEEAEIRKVLNETRESPYNRAKMKEGQSVDDVLIKCINLQNLVDDVRRNKISIVSART